MENIDKTIDETCNWIQNELKNMDSAEYIIDNAIPQTLSALAELVRARTYANRENTSE